MEKQILHSKIYGAEIPAIPLLVFHGLFGMLDNWGTFGRDLSATRPVHLIDLRNHGKSFHSDDMSHEDLANDILNYLEAFNLSKVHLLGHSLGGKAVMQFAMIYPEKIEKLIVVDIGPKSYPPHHQGILKALNEVDLSQVKTRGEVEDILHQYIPEKSVVYFLAKSLCWDKKKRLAWRFNLKTLTEKYTEFVSNAIKFGTFNGETLFIAGEKSNYILPQDSFLIKQQFPNSSIIHIKNAGHWVQAENPKDFYDAVYDFLKT